MHPLTKRSLTAKTESQINESLAAKIGNWSKRRLDAVCVVGFSAFSDAVTQTSTGTGSSLRKSDCLFANRLLAKLTKHAPAQFSPSHEYFLVKNLGFVYDNCN